MRPGGGKAKGGKWEREVCRRLSLWVTDNQKQDVFWRSAMSGGRATVARGKVRQCGDICAVADEGYAFCSEWFIECKHVRSLDLGSFFIKSTGVLAKFWHKANREARKYKRDPMIICKQNGWPALVVTKRDAVAHWAAPVIRTEVIDVTRFEDILTCPHSDKTRANYWRFASQRQPA